MDELLESMVVSRLQTDDTLDETKRALVLAACRSDDTLATALEDKVPRRGGRYCNGGSKPHLIGGNTLEAPAGAKA